jgi:predicted ATPase
VIGTLVMLIQPIRIDRFLSFGTSIAATPLDDLDLVIGPNGPGKSNLLDAFDLLCNAPTDLAKPIRDGGGILEWIFKGPRSTHRWSVSKSRYWACTPTSCPPLQYF